MDQGSSENDSLVNNFAPTVTKFCVMWEGQALPHDTKLSNRRGKIVENRTFPSWSLIHGSSWSGLIKAEPDVNVMIYSWHHFDDSLFNPWKSEMLHKIIKMNSLWSSDTLWRHISGSTLAQIMAICLTAPCHYLNQCWPFISKIMWYWSEGIIMRRSGEIN